MSFRKRNVALGSSRLDDAPVTTPTKSQLPGTRPSPLDGRPVTSTGTSTLDSLLAGHGGLALGCSLLIEENGTTDYAGALLKFYAAEGLLQGHHVHVIGMPEQWGRELPGPVGENDKKGKSSDTVDKMKIAWRYESLGQFGANSGSRGGHLPYTNHHNSTSSTTTDLLYFHTDIATEKSRTQPAIPSTDPSTSEKPTNFSHTFDLTKRLVHPASSQITFYPLNPNSTQSPFTTILSKLVSSITTSSPTTIHRLLIPSLLSPALYPPHSYQPHHLLPFLQTLRSLLSTARLTILTTLPLSLYPRTTGLTTFIEVLQDGVLELSPFPHSAVPTSTGPSSNEDRDPPQGILRIHKLPILHDRGSGNAGYEEDWTFTLSRRTLSVMPFNLPPVEGDTQAQQEAEAGKGKKSDLEF